MAITALPTPPSRQDPTNFNDRADAFLGALPQFQSEANTLQTDVNNKQIACAISEANAAASALASANTANTSKWISGTTYAIGDNRFSPINFLTYRRKTAGAGTTDPSLDSTNWQLLTGLGDVSTTGTQTIGGAKTFSSNVTILNGTNEMQLFLGSSGAYLYGNPSNYGIFKTSGVSLSVNVSNGDFTTNGNVTAYSDERLKKDWKNIPDTFIYDVTNVKYGVYTRIDTGEKQVGTSAQDWQKILPEVVLENEDGTLSLAYGNAALITVLKLAQKVIELEARIAKLEV